MALPTRVNRNGGGVALDPSELLQREFDGMFNRWMGGREAGNGAASGDRQGGCPGPSSRRLGM